MCGILGAINISVTTDLLDTIRHRGPDCQAIYSDKVNNHSIYLAHTRLSIVDLSAAGNQPMVSECGNYVLIFNGEIYNHLELREELKFKNFKGHSDTETLLYLLIEKGIDAIGLLNGIFGFAFFSKKAGTILIARDPFGVKPIYYFFDNKRLMFSSEIRPIHKVINTSLNLNALSMLLNLRYVPSPYTLHNEILKVRPGHYYEFKLNDERIELKTSPYVTKLPEYEEIDFDAAVDLYGDKLQHAVTRQLMGDVDMGVLLSGGIDSALIGGIAAQKLDRKMKAFTVGFDAEYRVNEIDLAAETAKYFNLEHHIVKMDVSTFFDTFAECSRIVEEPLATTSFIPMYYLSKLAAEHVKVVLTGQGADEPLGGYGRYQGEIVREQYPRIVFQLMKYIVQMSGTKRETLLRGARTLSIKEDIERFMNAYSLFKIDEVKRMTGREVAKDSCDLIAYYYTLLTNNKQSNVDKMMSIDLRMNLSDDLLLYTDKITMNFALECRVPMLDLELVGFLESLPTSFKVTKGKTKIIHRAFAKRMLPETIINRPKYGFQSPTDIWFRDKSDFVQSILLNGKLKDYLSQREIVKVLEQHKKGYNREKQIFLLLSINEWLNNNQ
jgi:asparagine synthase (glutamine-hydrolysing)